MLDFEDTFKNIDSAMYTETHQCMLGKLPDVQGYRWDSIFVPNLEHREAVEVRVEWLCYNLLFSKTRQRVRHNLLFGLIGYFGLLKDVNISFFLSFMKQIEDM